MLALDLDGTLLGPDGRVSHANIQAVARARAAGVFVTIGTGRGLIESAHALEAIGQTEPVIVAGGSMIACPVERRTLHRFGIGPALVRRTVEVLIDHDHPALVLKDPLHAGYDYLVIVGPRNAELDPVTRWWFEKMNVRVRYAAHLDDDEHPEHTVRVGACGLSGVLDRVEAALFADGRTDATVHNFPAVVAPQHARTLPSGEKLHIFEVFDKNAHKWSAIEHLAGSRGIAPSRIACIGDEINDRVMIHAAGLGVAMGNAVPEVKAVADRHTLSNAEDGVAHAIEHILDGRW